MKGVIRLFQQPDHVSTNKTIRGFIMSTYQIVQLADSLVKGWETRIPAMKGEEWNQFRWWLNYLQGYAMF